MNRSIVHIVLAVLAVLAFLYGLYVGIGASHNYTQGMYYLLLAIGFAGASKTL